jgi:hypothetical protein
MHFVLLDDGTLWEWWKFAGDEPSLAMDGGVI